MATKWPSERRWACLEKAVGKKGGFVELVVSSNAAGDGKARALWNHLRF